MLYWSILHLSSQHFEKECSLSPDPSESQCDACWFCITSSATFFCADVFSLSKFSLSVISVQSLARIHNVSKKADYKMRFMVSLCLTQGDKMLQRSYYNACQKQFASREAFEQKRFLSLLWKHFLVTGSLLKGQVSHRTRCHFTLCFKSGIRHNWKSESRRIKRKRSVCDL